MTRVLHISNTDIEVDSRIRKELKSLGELLGVDVLVLGVPRANESGVVVLDGAQYQKIRLVSRVLASLPRAIRYFFELIEFTVKATMMGKRARPGIVHCHDAFALPAGRILKMVLGCKLVYDAHELESKKNAQNAILSCATSLIERSCWNGVDMLVSVSDSIIEWYMRNLGNKPAVLVLNSPVTTESIGVHFDPDTRANYFHVKYAIPNDHQIFVYLGIMTPGRGIEMCLDAFADGPKSAHVVFIGFGSLEKVINEYAEAYPNIHFHQAVPHDQVVSLVCSADYGLCLVENVSLSDYYCLPNKLFEYCFARLPVLASDFPEISRLVEQYSLGVCCEPTSSSVRSALEYLAGCRPTRPASDITPLSWEAQAARLASAYENQLMPVNSRSLR